ncbi:hypothetical protein BIWAKO_06478 [Bosea sp. BIWAKO-01]|nr:hypothetical protein BIWAKO_06478 [Bosea sp. BIWAKO-01]
MAECHRNPLFAIHAAKSTLSIRRRLIPLNEQLACHRKAAMGVTYLLIPPAQIRSHDHQLADMDLALLPFTVRDKNDPSDSRRVS